MKIEPLLFLFVGLVAVVFIVCGTKREGYYSDYQQMSLLPFITPPHAPGFLGGVEQIQLQEQFPDPPVPRIAYYNPPPWQNVYETGTAYDPNIYSAFGTVTPDDIWMF